MSYHKYGVNFNGRRIVHPGAYDSIDASGMTIASDSSSNIPIVIGSSVSGESGVIHWFNDIQPARDYLQGGDVLTALEIMFKPTPNDGVGVSRVGVLIVNQTVKATATIGGAVIHSTEYGENGNKTQVKIEDGTLTGTKRITATRWDKEITEVYDNLGALFTISYDGDSAYCAINITVDASGNATKLSTKVGADAETATEDLAISLTDPRYHTIDKLVKYLNSISGYTARILNYRNSEVITSTLIAATDTSITTEICVMGDTNAYLPSINAFSDIIELESMPEALQNTEYTNLSGGSQGNIPASWATHLSKIKSEFSDVLVLLSSDESIHAEAISHIEQMEKRSQKQVLFTGGGKGETVRDVCLRASRIDNSRVVLGYPDIYHTSVNSGKEKLPAYFTGALLAGLVCGNDHAEPITFKSVNVTGLGVDLMAGDPDVDELIVSGVCALEKVRGGGFRVVQGITTYISENNTLYREISVRRSADKLSETVRSTLESTFVGKRGLPVAPSAVHTKTLDILEQHIKEGSITAYKDIKVVMQGTAIRVTYEVAPAEPINFILVTSSFVPLGTVSN